MDTWPKRPDGSNKTVGEMTKDERRSVFASAARRTKEYFENPHVVAGITAILNSEGKPN